MLGSMVPLKDELLSRLAAEANVAQFLSFGPGLDLPQRHAWVRGHPPGRRFPDPATAVEALLAAAGRGVAAAVLNPGALAHTSYAVRDAVEAAGIPVVEVHLSNVHARERWRHHLAVAPAAAGVIAGLGPASYDLGLRAAADLLARRA